MAGYRFDRITGQTAAVEHLQNALRTGQISQAYLINGERGAGKRELACAFAAALQCPDRREEGGRIEPCGRCAACRQIAAGSHPDVITVTNELAGVQTKTNTIGVKTARLVQGNVCIRPYEGPYKIYIIPDAQNLNQQAQNALLKTLEEPPSYAVFLLLSENTSAFLPTVLSRCVTLQLRTVPEKDLLRMLEREGLTGEKAITAARLSHGNPGRCRELALNADRIRMREEMTALFKRMPHVNSVEIADYTDNLLVGKKSGSPADAGLSNSDIAASAADGRPPAEEFLDLGRSWFRDILTAKACSDTDGLIFREEVQYISTIAGKLSYPSLETILQAFDQADRFRAARGNEGQILQILLLKIRRMMAAAG